MRRGTAAASALLVFALTGAVGAQPISLLGVRSWAYWLSNIEARTVAGSDFDMAIIDYSSDGSQTKAFTKEEVERMERKPDGSRRIIIAYLSIGEAESYRYYWQPSWRSDSPPWLDRENPDWAENYKVRYWDPAWQAIIYGSPHAYLDRILAAGFDGVMLDIVDGFEYYADRRPQAPEEMRAFVEKISRYAKGRHPGFLILPQNAESLLTAARYREAVDGIVKEDLYYGMTRDGAKNSPVATADSRAYLELSLAAGKPVFTIDYVRRASQVAEVYEASRRDGFVPYASRRDLSSLTVNRGWDP